MLQPRHQSLQGKEKNEAPQTALKRCRWTLYCAISGAGVARRGAPALRNGAERDGTERGGMGQGREGQARSFTAEYMGFLYCLEPGRVLNAE